MALDDGDRWIVRQNIDRFERQLQIERDEGRRRQLQRLLDAERQKMKRPSTIG
jgi:hypothetical protein